LASLFLASMVVVACSSKAKCTPGTLYVDVALDENAILADHIVIFTNTPATSLTIPRTPGSLDDVFATVTWPTGYPANMLVNVHFEAYVGTTLLGVDVQPIHFGPSCVNTLTTIDGDYIAPDLYSADAIDGG
jgi:hypothetical protein